uniref:Uncharacterized protein n=1 Tax=Cajanus cajan TaxID=3821 RepID=A0A151QKW2_CAJCA|nr:hypothetical protein KK1_049606 [Cajanus cajan]
MICDVGSNSFKYTHLNNWLSNYAKKPLYPNYYNFIELLELLSEMLLKGNILPTYNYVTKKILCLMGMKYKKIYSYHNDCILYKKDFDRLYECPLCGIFQNKLKEGDFDSWVSKGPPMKVLWYLPIVPRLM